MCSGPFFPDKGTLDIIIPVLWFSGFEPVVLVALMVTILSSSAIRH